MDCVELRGAVDADAVVAFPVGLATVVDADVVLSFPVVITVELPEVVDAGFVVISVVIGLAGLVEVVQSSSLSSLPS